VARRHLLSTVTALAFALGFGAGVFGAWLLEPPADAGSRAALVARAGAHDRAPERAEEPLPSISGAVATAARPLTSPAATTVLPSAPESVQPDAELVTAALSGGLSREAELSSQARLAKAVLPEPQRSIDQVTVRRGDTLIDILGRAGIAQAEAHAAVRSLRTVYDPRRLRAGQELSIRAENEPAGAGPRRLLGLDFDLDFDHAVRVTRDPDGQYAAAKVARPQRRDLLHRAGIIDDSLYMSAERAALPHDVIIGLIKLFSWDVDFQRDVRRGDQFETLFEVVSLEDGSADTRGGDLVYAALSIDGRLLEGYRFELPDGRVAYFDRSGKSLRKFLLRTPMDGARLSSGFGMRRHPILGYTRMHKGVDFAAPRGTPIYAAGEGKVEVAKRHGGYGKYVRIRHTGEYSTAYAHLSGFAKGIAPGRRVRQGQVIGYVGTTGRSTGPHLHYEVLRSGAPINPLRLKQPPNQQLAGADLKRFQTEVERIDRLRADPPRSTQLASRGQ
jgi:murein DD-endopeptidase MepM/ murein hydrolase activator NlpD